MPASSTARRAWLVHPHEYQSSRDASIHGATPPQRWLRVKAAAAYLSIGVGTLNKLRIYGGGPKYAKCGQTVIYDIVDLDGWASERKVRHTSERVRAA